MATSPGAVVRLLRPREWIKNVFVLGPLLFAREFGDPASVGRAAAATALFCVAASAVYVLNDLVDRDGDRAHPTKRRRPIASGRVSTRAALVTLGLLGAALLAVLPVWPRVLTAVWAYVGLFAAYSFGLRRIPVLDLVTIAAGFVLRVWTGAVAIGVPLSLWMAAVTFFLALFIAILKRRAEASLPGHSGREVLGTYGPEALDGAALATGAVTLVAYAAYTLAVHPPLAVTIPLVLAGLIRYDRIARGTAAGENPSRILWTDPWMLLVTGGWVAACLFLLGGR